MLVGYQSRPIAARAGRGVGGAALDVRGSKFALADTDAARERSGIVIDTVVGDFEEMRPTVHKDPAAALGAVGDRQPIDSRGVADEVAGERVSRDGSSGVTQGVGIAQLETSRGVTHHSRQQRGAGWERACLAAVVPGNLSVEIHPFAQHRNSGAYEGAGITVLGKGVDFHGQIPWNDGSEAGAFPA